MPLATRGVWGFYRSGVTKASYHHFDSYPEGLGVNFVETISQYDREQLNQIFDAITLVNANDRPTAEDFRRYGAYWAPFVSDGVNWYSLLRGAQEPSAAIPAYLSGHLRHMIDGSDFLRTGFDCEWAYIANLDDGVFEVYNKGPRMNLQSHRYCVEDPPGLDIPHCNLVLAGTFPLNAIPPNWVKEVTFV